MGMHYSIREYGEWEVIAAVLQRRDQRQTWARTVAQLYWSDTQEED